MVPVALGVVVGFLAALLSGRPKSQERDSSWPTNFAHRGASGRAPENTLEAYGLAAESGAGGIELDVHMTRDGEVVVIHDDEVERCTDGAGLVRDKSFSEIKALDAGYQFSPDAGGRFPYRGRGLRIPHLEEVFREFPDTKVNLDIKEDQTGFEEVVLRIVEDNKAEARTFVASQEHRVIKRFRRISNGRIPTSSSKFEVALFLILSRLRLERLLRPAFASLQVPPRHLGIELVTPRFIAAAHKLGVRVDVWTIDDPNEAHRLLDLGVDVIMTNEPAMLAEVLEQRKKTASIPTIPVN
ncbi:MAG: glycerophosphodiester phosphodiesterase [Rubrobacteraceae bacterium]